MKRIGRTLGVLFVLLLAASVAGCLAMRRGDIPYPQLEQRYADAQSRYVDLPSGVRMHYRDQGRRDGPALLLVHGFGASLHTWEPWVRELGDAYRVVSVDLPGFGLTRTPEGFALGTEAYVTALEQFAAAHGLDRFVVAGNSMGGAAAWSYALAHPERVQALVLVNSAGWPRPASAGERPPLIFALLANPLGRALLRDIDTTPMVRSGLRSAFADDRQVTEPMVARYVELSRAPGRRDQILNSRQPRDRADVPERLKAISAPTLVMTGQADGVIPAAQSRRFAEGIPGAKLILYPGVGHVPQEEIPERSAADLRRFLTDAGVAPPSTPAG
jgi:pimeloyl-ACP methyl ester carboxylesterase